MLVWVLLQGLVTSGCAWRTWVAGAEAFSAEVLLTWNKTPAQKGVGVAEVGSHPNLMYLQAVPVALGTCWDG